jgi:hypothetical protein
VGKEDRAARREESSRAGRRGGERPTVGGVATLEKREKRERGGRKSKKKGGQYSHFTFFPYFQHQGEVVYLSNDFVEKAAPLKKSEPTLFFKEPEPCQTSHLIIMNKKYCNIFQNYHSLYIILVDAAVQLERKIFVAPIQRTC